MTRGKFKTHNLTALVIISQSISMPAGGSTILISTCWRWKIRDEKEEEDDGNGEEDGGWEGSCYTNTEPSDLTR